MESRSRSCWQISPPGDQFGEEQLEDLVKTNAFLTADDIRALILDEVSDWIEGREQRDDATVVTLKVDWSTPPTHSQPTEFR